MTVIKVTFDKEFFSRMLRQAEARKQVATTNFTLNPNGICYPHDLMGVWTVAIPGTNLLLTNPLSHALGYPSTHIRFSPNDLLVNDIYYEVEEFLVDTAIFPFKIIELGPYEFLSNLEYASDRDPFGGFFDTNNPILTERWPEAYHESIL